MKSTRTIDDVLTSVSDLFWDENGEEYVPTIHSRNGDDDTPLHVVCWRNDVEGATILIAAGADVNALGDMEYTPLHVAVAQQNAAMVEHLLKSGADPDIICDFGSKALPESLRGADLFTLFYDLQKVDPHHDAIRRLSRESSITSPIWPPQQNP